MNIKQSGFTLIDLMIVITIFGVLATLAVPMYQDYTIKAKTIPVAFPEVKRVVSIYYDKNGKFPTSLADIGLTDADVKTNGIEKVKIGSDIATTNSHIKVAGGVEITYASNPELGEAQGKKLVYRAYQQQVQKDDQGNPIISGNVLLGRGSLIWDIDEGFAKTTLPAKYRP